jgi:heme/copper-type cytochrome/quinol oxidase subunit 2
MTQGRRIALIAAVVVIAIVGFIVLKPDDDNKKTSQTTTPAPAATTPAGDTTATQPTTPAKPAPPPVPQIKVEGGKPVGGIKTIEVNKGERIRFVVSSDVTDHIHVHGYDFMKDVAPGQKARFSFPAKIDGEFEVELEDRGEQIAKLVVNP